LPDRDDDRRDDFLLLRSYLLTLFNIKSLVFYNL
jgi:hypothetical protein